MVLKILDHVCLYKSGCSSVIDKVKLSET